MDWDQLLQHLTGWDANGPLGYPDPYMRGRAPSGMAAPEGPQLPEGWNPASPSMMPSTQSLGDRLGGYYGSLPGVQGLRQMFGR